MQLDNLKATATATAIDTACATSGKLVVIEVKLSMILSLGFDQGKKLDPYQLAASLIDNFVSQHEHYPPCELIDSLSIIEIQED